MISERETLQRIGVWMVEGRTALPDHVLDAVLDQLPTKPQRRPWWSARRIPDMSSIAKWAMAAAAVVVVAIVSFNLLRSPDSDRVGIGTPAPAMSASRSPATSPSRPAPTLAPSPAIRPGPYRWTTPGGKVTVVVPDGWSASQDSLTKGSGAAELRLTPHLPGSGSDVSRVFTDACVTDTATAPNSRYVLVGSSAADLVLALEDQIATDATTSTFASGTRTVLREAVGLDRSTCSEGRGGWLKVWLNASKAEYFALEVGQRGAVYIFEEDGERFVFSAQIGDQARDADVAELEAIVASFEFTSGAQGSAPSPALEPPRLPGTTESPAGVYGWQGGVGSLTGMHKIKDGHETALIFKLGPACLAWREGQQAEPVHVAGFDGVVVEPYQPTMSFGRSGPDERTRAYAFAVGDSTLCVFVTHDAGAPDAMVAAALDVLDTLRAEQLGDGRLRVNFTLDEGWDVG